MEEERKKSALLAAGRLAIAARMVILSDALNLSQRIKEMEEALNNYDGEIISS